MKKNIRIARELLKLARELVAIEFSTQESMDAYLKEHPDADRSNHRVVKKDVPAPAAPSKSWLPWKKKQPPAPAPAPAAPAPAPVKPDSPEQIKRDREYLLKMEEKTTKSMGEYEKQNPKRWKSQI